MNVPSARREAAAAADAQESGARLTASGKVPQNLKYAPLAQLVEHLTLNQGVQGSSP